MVCPGKTRVCFFVAILAFVVSCATNAAAQDVLTWHNDNARTGQNLAERILTLQNVNPVTFGKLFIIHVDGKVVAEPLFAKAIEMPGHGVRSVLFVVTEHDTAYAFDADSGSLFWRAILLKPGESPSDTLNCSQEAPEIGITATPVIDLQRGHGTIYVVAMSRDGNGHYFQRLHALDLQTGREEFGGPKDITATFPGTGVESHDGAAVFNPRQYEERAALLLLNGTVYTSWASHCDANPYNGWIMAYDSRTLRQKAVLDLTPNGEKGSIWQSGAGPAADPEGNIYLLTGNGSFDTTLDRQGFPSLGDFGNSFVKIWPGAAKLSVVDYFTPFNVLEENRADMDLGAGGAVVLPRMREAAGKIVELVVSAAKDKNIYLLNRADMGEFHPGNRGVYQELPNALKGSDYRGQPAYFDGRLYCSSAGDFLYEFRFVSARLLPQPASHTTQKFAYPGVAPSVSADGLRNAIVWAVENEPGKPFGPAVLHAYDAADLSRELYSSNAAANGRDSFGYGNKFITPVVADGKVYVGTTDGVGVFGLLPATRKHARPPRDNQGAKPTPRR